MPLKSHHQQQFLVKIDGVEAFFNKATAPKEVFTKTKYASPDTGHIYHHVSFIENEDVTLTKLYDAVKDKDLVTWHKNRKNTNAERFVVTIQPVNPDVSSSLISGAPTLTLTGCEVLGFKYPEVDRDGSAMATLEIDLCFADHSYQ